MKVQSTVQLLNRIPLDAVKEPNLLQRQMRFAIDRLPLPVIRYELIAISLVLVTDRQSTSPSFRFI